MFILFHPYIIFLIGLIITILFIVGLFKEKQLKDELGIDYNNYYDRYNTIREKNPKTKHLLYFCRTYLWYSHSSNYDF